MMGLPPARREQHSGPARVRVLALLKRVPAGRVITREAIAAYLELPSPVVTTVLSRLNEEEREMHAWHRVVAAGGAIGRGPWREAQFACLVREGIAVSPAGVVQDMNRVLLSDLDAPMGSQRAAPEPASSPPRSRSRGMKDRPGP